MPVEAGFMLGARKISASQEESPGRGQDRTLDRNGGLDDPARCGQRVGRNLRGEKLKLGKAEKRR
jgi:hypothetical protein